jgi:hypothetical protein
MILHRTALWVLLVACSVAGGLYALVSEARTARSDGASPRIERYVFGALTGVGVGMCVATVVLFAAAIIVRLEP